MNLGINLYCYGEDSVLPLDRKIELMCENGFTNTFIGASREKVNDVSCAKLEKAKITVDTLHAPFKNINTMWFDGEDGDIMLTTLTDSVKLCKQYNIPVLICHLSSGVPAPRISDVGNARFDRLMECADKEGVVIAYENQRYLANIASAFEAYPQAGFCWDVGHEGCLSVKRRFMPLFGDKLIALHLHDNSCEPNMDHHCLPYDGALDYEYVAKTIAESGFSGTLMLEVERNKYGFYENTPPEEYYRRAAAAVRRLDKRICEIRSEK